MARNRVIYQSQALYIAPSSTGYHMQSGNQLGTTRSFNAYNNQNWTGVTGIIFNDGDGGDTLGVGNMIAYRSLIEPLHRVQSCNFNFTINRQDINEFGKLSRIDSIVMESPTVGLDFNYYLTDGGNERKLGFNIPTTFFDREGAAINQIASTGDGCISGYSALSGLIEDTQGNNFFIVTSKEGTDVQGDTVTSSSADFDVISVGNGFISDYTIEAAVGAIPNVNITIEAFNIRVDDLISGAVNGGITGNKVPGVDQNNGEQVDINYNFDAGTLLTTGDATGIYGPAVTANPYADQITALRPGDITLEFFENGGGAFSQSNYDGFADLDGDGKIHIQSFTVSIPMSRTILGRLGNTFGYARLIDLPLNIDVSISAIVSELQSGNLFERLDKANKQDFQLKLHRAGADGAQGDLAFQIDVKGARLESESYSNAIGDNETVDISFSTQLGGANDTLNGVFMNGTYPAWTTIPYWPLGAKKLDTAAFIGTVTAP